MTKNVIYEIKDSKIRQNVEIMTKSHEKKVRIMTADNETVNYESVN